MVDEETVVPPAEGSATAAPANDASDGSASPAPAEDAAPETATPPASGSSEGQPA